MACFILSKKLEGIELQKALKRVKIKMSDIKKVYYANSKTLICLKKRVKSKIDKKLFPSREEEREIIEVYEFVQRQLYLIEQERNAEIQTTINEIKSISGIEREIFGRAVLGLRGFKMPMRLNLYFVKFGRSKIIDTEISSGDIVLISKGEALKSDLTATVSEVKKNYIVVAFENRPPKWVYSDGIRIDLYVNDVTFKRMEENLLYLKDASGRQRELRNIALGIKKPKEVKEVEFVKKTDINPTQESAVKKALGSDIFLIHGPPGTGKTSTLIELILQEVDRDKKVLATADSNTAVDNMLKRLAKFDLNLVRIGHPARILYELEEFSIFAKYEKSLQAQAIKKGWEDVALLVKQRDLHSKPTQARCRGMSYDRILTLAARGKSQRGVSVATMQSMAKWIKADKKIEALVKNLRYEEEKVYKQIIKEADVVLSTNAMVMSEVLKDEIFDIAVIDEGSQQIKASTLIPIMHSNSFVIAGDHKQLPPTVISDAKELKYSLFEELIKQYTTHSSMLKIQYRMNEKIMEFPNKKFYNGELKAHESVKEHTLRDFNLKPPSIYKEVLEPSLPIAFVDTKGIEAKENLPDRSTSFENPKEAEIVKEIVYELLNMGLKEEHIGVISPYLSQVKRIKKLIDKDDKIIEVKSVDGFQGREKEVIIISFVRSNEKGEIGFLKDLRRLNVAITRPKRKLLCIGDTKTLSNDGVYREFIDYIEQKGRILCKN
jgi:predicted DNA helicase